MKTLKIIFGVFTLLVIAFSFVPIEYHNAFTDMVFGTSIASLATIYTPGCGTPPPPTCQDCPVKELGGVRGFWIQKSSYAFNDLTNPVEWDAAICAGNVYVFPFANGTVSEDTTMSDGYGNLPQTLDSYTYTVDIHEPQYKNNVPFWNFIKKGNSFLFGYKTQTMLHLSAVAAQFSPTAPVGKDVKSKIDMAIKVMFVQQDLITPVSAGAAESIFDTCVDC